MERTSIIHRREMYESTYNVSSCRLLNNPDIIYNTVAYLLKARVVELGETGIARQPLCMHSAIPEPIAKQHTHAAMGGSVGSGVFYAVRAEAI
jgi:hypothetical protein